jgi:23S rRNA maturation-related 3'-5' exoribonuclease YhaM
MARLPRITELAADSVGWGFYLCARKEVRTGRSGEYLSLMLQDASGEIRAKVFQEVELTKREFDAGEFVKIQGRGNSFNQQLELVLDKIRRVMPERDATDDLHAKIDKSRSDRRGGGKGGERLCR